MSFFFFFFFFFFVWAGGRGQTMSLGDQVLYSENMLCINVGRRCVHQTTVGLKNGQELALGLSRVLLYTWKPPRIWDSCFLKRRDSKERSFSKSKTEFWQLLWNVGR
jgi:hypothetical protein